MPTTGGTPGLKGHRPKRNAQVVQKLLDAGAIAFGKANLHELAYGITNNNAGFGAARNPYDPTRIPGGSSGGVGVAVGARIVPGGIGSDTGGSVRVPAALCGIVGFRPTTGRWSQAGVVPISHTRDTPGPMTRSVADCALLDSVVTGSAAPAAATSLKGLRLGVPRAHFWSPLDTETARLMEDVLARLRNAGAILVEADIADVGRLDNEAGFPIALYETVADLNAYLAGHGSPLRYAELVAQCASPDVAGLLQSLHGEAAIPEAAYRHALDVLRPQLQAAYRDHFRSEANRGDRLSDHAPARRADRRRRDGAAQRPARADLLHLHPQLEPGQRRRHSRHQPAGGHDRRRPAARHRARRGRRRRCPPAGDRAGGRSACCRSCPPPHSNEEVSHEHTGSRSSPPAAASFSAAAGTAVLGTGWVGSAARPSRRNSRSASSSR